VIKPLFRLCATNVIDTLHNVSFFERERDFHLHLQRRRRSTLSKSTHQTTLPFAEPFCIYGNWIMI
jgi:hypothetical protein